MELFEKIGIVKSAEERLKETVSIEEVKALIKHAAEQGIGVDNHELSSLTDALYQYQKDGSLDSHKRMLENYTCLVKLTRPQNGRILLENSKTYMYIKAPIMLTVTLIVLMIISEVIGNWLADKPEPEEGWVFLALTVHRYILDYLSPFLWGAIGACVYLLKRLYDIAQDGSFDSAKLHGWYIRVILGSILGAIVFHIYNISELDEGSVNIDAKALAFFTGLGVKVVYGAFERTIELLAEKLNLGAVRRARQGVMNVRSYLNSMINEVDPAAEPEKHRLLTELRDKAEREGA